MKPRERVLAALAHQVPDQVPRFEIWIDGLLDELNQPDVPSAHAGLGQDCIMMPTKTPTGSNAWKTGVDEWGRVWQDGTYAGGMVDTYQDLERYSHPASYVESHFDANWVRAIQVRYPDHCHIYGSHNLGPLTAADMASTHSGLR